MKRFIPIIVILLIVSSLGTLNKTVYADAVSPLTRTFPGVGTSGESGTAILTATNPTGDSTQPPTQVDITLNMAVGSQNAGIYKGRCSDFGSPLPTTTSAAYPLNTVIRGIGDSSGVSHTTLNGVSLATLNTYPGTPRYSIIVTDAQRNILSCVDVGMPSTYLPMILQLPVREVVFPVTQPSFVVEGLPGPLKLAISLNGALSGTHYSSFVRNASSCDDPNLVNATVAYTLTDVVDGKSVAANILPPDNFLPSGLVITVEPPGGKPTDFVACTESTPYVVSADLKPLDNSGVSGVVTATELIRSPGTLIEIKLGGDLQGQFTDLSTNAQRQYAASIHRGRCPVPEQTVAYPLTRVRFGASSTIRPEPINELTRGDIPYVIVLSRLTGRPGVYLACAEIPYFGPNQSGDIPGMPTSGSTTPPIIPLALATSGLVAVILGLWLLAHASRRKYYM